MDLYGYLGPPVLLFLFVNISSLISMIILFGTNKVVFLLLFEKPTPLTLSFMVMLPITPYSTAFSQSLSNIECDEESFQLEHDLILTLLTV